MTYPPFHSCIFQQLPRDGLVPSAQYIYKPLESHRGEIRVLDIQPSSSLSTPVHCRVRHVCIWDDPRPTYEAVSYAWGEVSRKSSVVVDGELLELPASAEECLRYFRLPDRPRTVWIDAGSIHQADRAERSKQVAMMAEIYRHSTRTIVWLGKADESTSLVATQLKTVLEELYSPLGEEIMSHAYPDRFKPRQSNGIVALLTFFERPWFSRLWVVQEVALAPRSECQCGDFNFQTLDLLRAAKWITVAYRKAYAYNGVNMASCIRSYCDSRYGGRTPSTMDWHSIFGLLVATSSYMECTDPRDRVYGVLGLLRSDPDAEIPPELRPDYEKTTIQVYRDATRWLCQEYGVPDMLIRVCHRHASDIDGQAPSWVRRWDRTWDPYLDPVSLTAPYNAAQGFIPDDERISTGPDRVTVQGYICGRIMSRRRMPARWNRNARYQLALYRAARALAAKSMPGDGEGNHWKAVVCTLVAGSINSGDRDDPAFIFRAAAAHWNYLRFKRKVPSEADRFSEDVEERTRLAALYQIGLIAALFNRSFFATTTGQVGLAPLLIKAGDVVTVVHDCKVPLILRPCCDGYRLVGEAYVYGIMDGEAVQHQQKLQQAPTTFSLR